MISYQTCGDYFLEPFGLRLVIKVDAPRQVISCERKVVLHIHIMKKTDVCSFLTSHLIIKGYTL